MGGWLRSSPSHAPLPRRTLPWARAGGLVVPGLPRPWPATCALRWADGYVALAGAQPSLLPRPTPHGPGRELSGPWLPRRPPPLPDHPLTWGSGQCVWRCRWGFWGRFVLRLVPFPLTVLPFFSSGSIVRPRAARCLLGPEATSFCSSHAPCLLSDLFRPADCPVCCGWLRLILPEWGVPCFTGEAYADLKEWWSKALKSRQRSHFRLSWADRSLGSRLGLAKSSISSSSRTSRPPASASMSSASIVLTVEQDLAVSSVPHHDRDSQVEDLPAGSVAPTAGQASPGPSPPSPPVPPGLSAWMSSVNSFMARMEGHLTSGSHSPTPRRRRSPSPASLSPVPPSDLW
ncbi:hypothetical protein GWK47_031271 [Chionoecetes opilio]|uniref:Uncharacterized protein n=1 Tax=Chionoecetes opilio TaxID=41210 RepID=A0A8J4YJ19_CHIOP|nr:hypothetical protein GWK47_031271 [Chionoecetes opilio]